MAAVTVLTIDGPSGSGKGTVSRRLAAILGWHLLDSGALYRLVALAGERAGLATDDVDGHARLARSMDVTFGTRADGSEVVHLGGIDVTEAMREETISQGASRVAAWTPVREALLDRQRAFAKPPGLVADGRDMGTVVFPSAPLKIYLTATAEERALRRHKQLKDKGSAVSLAALSREIAERDERDYSRAIAPLRPAPDALLLDSTGRSVEQVVAQVLAAGRQRSLWP
jgi:cytidylate kinase